MPGPLHEGALTMAIHKKVTYPEKGEAKHLVLPAFSFQPTDALAQVIVDAWKNKTLRDQLLARDLKTKLPTKGAVQAATKRITAAGYDLKRAVVITEAEHDNDYVMQSDDEIVFVLPNSDRVTAAPKNLLDTAKLLMGCTPNGI
jgi:hypothetical protein